ncbi:MAG: chloride channel protein [Actinobacteria bacterium]|nr:chloride channel protein [Actinomycetota bacterium]
MSAVTPPTSSPTDDSPPSPSAGVVARLLGTSALLGVIIAVGFHWFTEVMHHTQHWVWHTIAGEDASSLVTIAVATVGGAALGVALLAVPGHGGPHPAEHHGLLSPATVPWSAIVGSLVVGFVGLVAGASLGPEGAVIPAAVGVSVLAAGWARLPARMTLLVQGSGLSALLASMFGSPIAGVVPLLEAVPAGAVPTMALLMLPSLTAAATAVLTQQVFDWSAIGRLPLEAIEFRPMHLVWAVVIGVAAGATGLLIDRVTRLLRRVTTRLDARNVLLSTTAGGLVLGVLYAIGGDPVRFAGIPELLSLAADADTAWVALGSMAVKVLATSVCLAAGYRGGKIFPAAFIGGATGLALQLAIPSIPLTLALAVGLSASMATAMAFPVIAAVNAAAILPSSVLPLALLGIVAAHAVHLLAAQLTTGSPARSSAG